MGGGGGEEVIHKSENIITPTKHTLIRNRRVFYLKDWGQSPKISNGEWFNSYHAKYLDRMKAVRVFNDNPTVHYYSHLWYIDNFQVIPGFDLQSASPFYVEKFIIEFLKEQKVSRVSRGVYLSLTYAVVFVYCGS